jgi:NAD(P)-dependent dehydrogenase (short-subunit alcohol dehydrogenase family)
VELMLADLAVQAEVRRLAEEFRVRHDRLDVLVNNAGLVQSERTETPDGIETTLAVNHWHPSAQRTCCSTCSKQSAPSRVVTVSSEAERGEHRPSTTCSPRRSYRGFPVYG